VSKVNISIDDVSPHPRSSIIVIDQCERIIKDFPDVKFTLFVPLAYWRTIPLPPESVSNKPFRVDAFPDFCKFIKDLPPENFEIAYHGLLHGIPGQSNNDEFKTISLEEARDKFSTMKALSKNAGLDNTFKNIFRPPAWRMSPGSFQAAEEAGIDILALSPKDYAVESYNGADKKFKKVVYYNVNPPFDPFSLYPLTEIVYHACQWDKNYLDKDKADDLINFLKTHKAEIDFCFMDEMIDGKV
jgi:hypothetical protein|tara:strand:+ start:874 stop:1602 length:729 start_codon:yes stop_codon:yes gene_type:complete